MKYVAGPRSYFLFQKLQTRWTSHATHWALLPAGAGQMPVAVTAAATRTPSVNGAATEGVQPYTRGKLSGVSAAHGATDIERASERSVDLARAPLYSTTSCQRTINVTCARRGRDTSSGLSGGADPTTVYHGHHGCWKSVYLPVESRALSLRPLTLLTVSELA